MTLWSVIPCANRARNGRPVHNAWAPRPFGQIALPLGRHGMLFYAATHALRRFAALSHSTKKETATPRGLFPLSALMDAIKSALTACSPLTLRRGARQTRLLQCHCAALASCRVHSPAQEKARWEQDAQLRAIPYR